MVVTADSQKIIKNKSRYSNKRVSSQRNYSKRSGYKKNRIVLGRQVSLFPIPFICALFIFSIYISISDSYCYVRPPIFLLTDIALPEESPEEISLEKTLKAAIDFSLLTPGHTSMDNSDRQLYLTSYTLRVDDRYSIVAQKFQIDVDSILSVNGIKNNDLLPVGTEIKIPNISGIYYTINKGDTLTSISTEYNLDIEEIRVINNLYSTVIHSGDKLYLPHVKMKKSELNRIIGNKFELPAKGSVKNNYGGYIDPVTGLKVYNYGIDILNKRGTAVYAAKDGVVGNTSYNSYYGRVVLINHSNSFQSMYGCLDSIVVTPGQNISRGELLGYMGNSGFKPLEHLQFSIFKNKEDVDTLEYIF